MTSRPVVDARMEIYLHRLESALRGIPPEYQQDILREIRAHIMDSAQPSADHAGAIDRVLTFEEITAMIEANAPNL